MHTASDPLATELFDLTGWTDQGRVNNVEQYTLGFLMRKLPPVILEDGKFLALAVHAQGDGTFHFAYAEPYDKEFRGSHITNANTMEDAACALLISLIRQGIVEVER